MKAVIPFQGFYNSVHSYNLDNAAEQMIQDSSGSPVAGLTDRFAGCWHYTNEMLVAYCAEYVGTFAATAGIAVTFESVDSPREYNFTTDRIFVDIDGAEVCRLFASVNADRLDKIARERHTSYDGFISFYNPNWQEWGDVQTWEPEQLHTLILACLPDDFPEEFETYAVDDCNGLVSNLVYASLSDEGKRLIRIADYLRAREERKYRKDWSTHPYGVRSVPASLMHLAELNGQLTLNLE